VHKDKLRNCSCNQFK